MAWGDYDNDGDLDLLIAGADTGGYGVVALYRNNGDGEAVQHLPTNDRRLDDLPLRGGLGRLR